MTPWETVTDPQCPKEGELFKEIHAYGKVFEIRYGYYEERDRYTRYPEPIPLYPDFLQHPCYTDNGTPFATEIQDVCENFLGNRDANSVCGDCSYYRQREELLGTCTHPNRKAPKENL